MTTASEYLTQMTIEQVVFDRAHPSMQALLAKTTKLPGLYAFESDGTLLRIGESRNLGQRIEDHLNAAYKPKSAEYLHYHLFFRELLGREITLRWLHTPLAGREEIELIMRRSLPIEWERLEKLRRRKESVDYGAAVRTVIGGGPSFVAAPPSPPKRASAPMPPAPATPVSAMPKSAPQKVTGAGGLSREAQRAILNASPELEEYGISHDRLNWRLRADGRAVAREFAATGNGYVWGRDIPGDEYEVDARGWVNVRRFTSDELRRIVERSIMTMTN